MIWTNFKNAGERCFTYVLFCVSSWLEEIRKSHFFSLNIYLNAREMIAKATTFIHCKVSTL